MPDDTPKRAPLFDHYNAVLVMSSPEFLEEHRLLLEIGDGDSRDGLGLRAVYHAGRSIGFLRDRKRRPFEYILSKIGLLRDREKRPLEFTFLRPPSRYPESHDVVRNEIYEDFIRLVEAEKKLGAKPRNYFVV